jgi:hypothetical protein
MTNTGAILFQSQTAVVALSWNLKDSNLTTGRAHTRPETILTNANANVIEIDAREAQNIARVMQSDIVPLPK